MKWFLILLLLACPSVVAQTRNVSANPATGSLVWPTVSNFKSVNSIPSGTGTITGTSSGTNTGDQTTISGNAATATALQTPRNINGVAFDGTSNITVAAAGSTLSDTVTIGNGGTGLTVLGLGLQVLRVNAGATGLEYATLAGGGDMLLGTSQTVTAAKTFNNLTLLLRNVADTFNGRFLNTNTADRVYTLKDADGTLAFTSDITGVNSGTNTGDQTTIVGITGTLSEFNTALTGADFASGGGTATGTNTGDQTTISGNAGSATVLATPRNINGVAFDGSTNITVTAAGSTLSDDVPYANIQDVSVTDRVLGRSTAGSGPIEEIPFTAGARTMNAKVAPWGVYNAAVSTVSAAFATDTYLVGSSCAIPDSSLQAKSMYHCVFNVVKTAAGTATPIINIRFGTAGTTADASRGTLTWSAQTAAIDEGVYEIWATFRTVGSGSSAVLQTLGNRTHRLSVTGLGSANSVSEPEIATSAGFDSTVASSIIGVSVNGGTSASWTISLVQSKLFNLQ